MDTSSLDSCRRRSAAAGASGEPLPWAQPDLYTFVKGDWTPYIIVQFPPNAGFCAGKCPFERPVLETEIMRAYDPHLSPGPSDRTSSGGPICRAPRGFTSRLDARGRRVPL